MARLFQCDFCGAIWEQRDAVALVDLEFGGEIERKIHGCPQHLPPTVFPAAEGHPLPDIDPVITSEQAQEIGLHPGEP